MFLDFLFGGDKTFLRGSVSAVTEEKIKKDWESVALLLAQKSPSQLRQALIVADRALDNALKDFIPGETMGERLKNAKDKFDWATYQKIWEAHKVRNNMVHEAGYEPQYYIVTEAVETLKQALISLGVRL
jgi:hypothetical protein